MSSDPKNQDDIIMGEELDLSPEEIAISDEVFAELRSDPEFRDVFHRVRDGNPPGADRDPEEAAPE